ncbi:biotin-dependent carboxyltransferase family protein [Gryllotalpicola protaetiae]|uniref:Biotin-dependent carboxyltransferase family protein n=1 Tax=Gryllotalpicola protaetiae TaxID=2419771 RepID=A0A387BJP3_9MICO|nr:biotin-dependent carboxyltransferase family protein [Gryllotalpicola protaetiae]AYG02948.1 biotin-dependent carboxyltransferase family protein [Gryllotalpicola protaetiae]
MSALEVTAVGLLATVQDRGRFGFLDQGVGASGFADRSSAALATRLVANAPDAALVEVLFGGLAVRARGAVEVAAAGAYCPITVTTASGRMHHAAMYELIELADGDELHLGAPTAGLRTYVAARGGVDVPQVLGSRSYDTLAAIGPAPLAVGDVLPVGAATAGDPVVDAVAPPWGVGEPPAGVVLDALLGPRDDWFTPDAVRALRTATFSVSPVSDRIGVRLEGAAPLERAITDELPSEPLALGSLQVPAGGHPIVFLADHPITGGYPVIAVLTAASIDRAAQLTPGQWVRFRVR